MNESSKFDKLNNKLDELHKFDELKDELTELLRCRMSQMSWVSCMSWRMRWLGTCLYGPSPNFYPSSRTKFARNKKGCFSLIASLAGYFVKENRTEPPHNKTNKMACAPAKTQISLGIRPV